MALGGISVSWDVTTPSGTSLAGTGQNDIRSLKTTLNQVLDSEHVFGATGGSNTGVHRKGSAVVFVGASSALSSTDTNGRLMLTSDTSRLHHAGSDNTMFLGGRYVPEMASVLSVNGTGTASAVTQQWAMEMGQFIFPTASLTTTVVLRNTYVVGLAVVSPAVPFVNLTLGNGIPVVGSVSGANLTVNHLSITSYGVATSSGTYLVNYFVSGIRAL